MIIYDDGKTTVIEVDCSDSLLNIPKKGWSYLLDEIKEAKENFLDDLDLVV